MPFALCKACKGLIAQATYGKSTELVVVVVVHAKIFIIQISGELFFFRHIPNVTRIDRTVPSYWRGLDFGAKIVTSCKRGGVV